MSNHTLNVTLSEIIEKNVEAAYTLIKQKQYWAACCIVQMIDSISDELIEDDQEHLEDCTEWMGLAVELDEIIARDYGYTAENPGTINCLNIQIPLTSWVG